MSIFRFVYAPAGRHVAARLFLGPKPGVLSGALMFDEAEWRDFRAALIHGAGADYRDNEIELTWEEDP